ncbi:hypothetical protein SHM7688_02580 [Shimia marina]|uniref:Uncharacterized protein n=1 Tax=Shimia marina TaxID=321267 RepID=A0A0P1FGM8_9RHOB|nr:hypothetical protein SHM7688_02580 [Shimia marina]
MIQTGADAARDFLFGDTGQHFGIGRRRFRAKVTVVCGQIPEILRDRFHGIKRFLKPFKGAGERPVRNRKHFVIRNHLLKVLCTTQRSNYH